MCGICGFVAKEKISMDALTKMSNSMVHRGPDDHGEEIVEIYSGWCLGMAHRRLSIIDLSERGHQPMYSPDHSVSVVFNGEIYNFRELREEIKDYPFSTDCDTEVIIAAYLKWGISFIEKLNGMFAVALFDKRSDTLFLMRDRIGKKPLYYYLNDDQELVFASELKAIQLYPTFNKRLNKKAIALYMRRLYFYAPDTVFENTFQLEPGCILKFCRGNVEKVKYWRIADKYNELRKRPITEYEEAKDELKALLKKAVSYRMISDVPLGAFLSGGFDSTLICALAQEQLPRPLKTFCIGFDDPKLNEAEYAKKVAQHLGTEHEEVYLSETDMFKLLDTIPKYYDEPFADSSQIPTMLVSALAKEKVTVALSGDGGDEFFGGYGVYRILEDAQYHADLGKLIYYIRKVPGLRNLDSWRKLPLAYRIASEDLDKNAKVQTGVNTYLKVLNDIMVFPAENYYFPFEDDYQEERYDMRRMLLDMDTYLPGDILTKVDRASMKYSLECRCPILDKDVMEYTFRLPTDYKIDKNHKKRILKDIVYDYVPAELVDRPKAGFCVPQNKWLIGPLKERVIGYTEKSFLERQGVFKPAETKAFVEAFMKTGDAKQGGKSYSQLIWPFFMFQEWYKEYMK